MMKGKGLVPLLVIALILVGLVIWKKTSSPARTLREQVDLVQLLPDDVKGADLGKLELYAGASPDEKVILARADGDWRVESHFNAPVSETKIDEYIEALEGLQGEFREEAASDEGLQTFDLTDDKAFHVVGYAKGASDPAFHLLVGKAADFRTVFMRASDQNKVYIEDTNLRQLAGVYGDDTSTAPTATPWLDKTVLKLEEDAITKLEIVTPDKSLTFEKQVPEPEPEETPAEGGEAAETAEPKPEPEAKWVLVAGGPGGEAKESGITNLMRKFTNLSASDIVDPTKTAEYGLDAPGFKATIHTKEGEPVVLEGGRGEGATDGYVRVASAGGDRVYKLDSYTFGQVFPKGSTLFTLEGFTYPDNAIDRIEVKQPEGNFAVVRSDASWTVESPAAALPVQTTTIDTLENMIQLWKPEDYADSSAGTGLDNPARSITFSVGGGENVTLLVGDASKTFDGYYAKVEGKDNVLAMSKADYQKAFIEPKNLYQLKLVDATASELHAIAVERAEDAFTLVQTDGDWAFSTGTADSTLDQDKASSLASALVGLQASGIITGERTPGALLATIRVTTQDGTSTYAVEAEQDGRYPVTLVEKNQPVWVDKAELDAVLVASASLTIAPEPASDATESTEESAPADEAAATEETAAPADEAAATEETAAPADESTTSEESAAPADEATATEVTAPSEEAAPAAAE